MTMNEDTPLLGHGRETKNGRHFTVSNRVLVAGLLIATALGITQVPILYVFRLMECDEFYRHNSVQILGGDRCNRNEIDAGTATHVSILGFTTMFFSLLNLFYAGWQIKRWGPRTAAIVQTAFPAIRIAIQILGVGIGGRKGIVIIQASQIINIIGGVAGYLLVLNTVAGEVVAASERTAMFGKLQGSVMLGTSIGYFLGGIVGDTWGLVRPFQMAVVLFTLSSVYCALSIPDIDPAKLTQNGGTVAKPKGLAALFGGLRVLSPKVIYLTDGRPVKYYGVTLLALGVFLGTLATGYAPMLIQMYSTAAFNFLPRENGYLMAANSLIRAIFLLFLFPRIISTGREWFSSTSDRAFDRSSSQLLAEDATNSTSTNGNAPQQGGVATVTTDMEESGRGFDILFLRWSLVADGLITAYTAFATKGWHIYMAGFLLPLASGSAPASKGIITEMSSPSERADALQAMTLVENLAMISTLGLFGAIFTVFSNIGKAYPTFFCNAAVAVTAVLVLLFLRFPPPDRNLTVAEDESVLVAED